jgi:hypothetical protein
MDANQLTHPVCVDKEKSVAENVRYRERERERERERKSDNYKSDMCIHVAYF